MNKMHLVDLYMAYQYKTGMVSEDSRWIYIFSNCRDPDDCDPFISFVIYFQGDRMLTCVGEKQ